MMRLMTIFLNPHFNSLLNIRLPLWLCGASVACLIFILSGIISTTMGLAGAGDIFFDGISSGILYSFSPTLMKINSSSNNGNGGDDFPNCYNPYKSSYPYNPLISSEIKDAHKVFLDNPKLGRGNTRILREYKDKLPQLSNYQKQALIGLILGDASVQKSTTGQYRIKFDYSKIKHEPYAYHIAEVLRHWVLTDPKDQGRQDSNYVASRFQTLTHPAFKELGDMFLSTGKKSIPKDLVKNHVTPVTLAYWFMDDGGKTDYSGRSNGIEFHTSSFKEEHVVEMAQQIKEKFGIDCWKAKNRQYPIIRVSSTCYSKVESLIKPFMIKEMHYKLPKSGE